MKSDSGSATAEFALALPAVITVIALLFQLSAWQLARAQLVVTAGAAARAASHLMTHIEVERLVSNLSPGTTVDISIDATSVCAKVSKPGWLPLAEQICTRLQGQ